MTFGPFDEPEGFDASPQPASTQGYTQSRHGEARGVQPHVARCRPQQRRGHRRTISGVCVSQRQPPIAATHRQPAAVPRPAARTGADTRSARSRCGARMRPIAAARRKCLDRAEGEILSCPLFNRRGAPPPRPVSRDRRSLDHGCDSDLLQCTVTGTAFRYLPQARRLFHCTTRRAGCSPSPPCALRRARRRSCG